MKNHEHNSNHDAADSFTSLLKEAVAGESLPPADPTLREALLNRLDQPAVEPALRTSVADRRRTFFQRAGIALASTAALALVTVIWQRPALEAVIGLNHSAAVKRELPALDRLGSRAQSKQAHWANREEPQSVLAPNSNQGRGAGGAPDDRYGNLRGLEEGGEATFADIGVAESAPSTASRTTATPRPTVTAAAPIGGPTTGVVSGPVPPVSGPAGMLPASTTPRSRMEPGRQSGLQPDDDKLRSYQVQPGKQPDANYSLPYGEANQPGNSAGQPGEPRGGKYGNVIDKRADKSLKREVDSLETVKESIKAEDSPASERKPRDPARPLSSGSESKNELAEVEKARPEVLAKLGQLNQLNETGDELRQKGKETELSRAKSLKDGEAKVTDAKGDEQKFSFYFGLSRDGVQPGEQYAKIIENEFLNPRNVDQALSTFSIDVDTASYANVRRFLTGGQLPPPDAVRLEEMVNYFKYKYPQPKGDEPFSVHTEMADCPWQPGHKLLRVGLQGKEIHRAERPASNIVFLIDTSGSMTDQNKLPLLKQAFTMLVGELNENDKVSIVTYAGNAGLRLPPTRGHEKETIIAAIDGMQSGGSTHGSAGISLAYEVAAAQFIKGGTNKVILATDGDLNVGITDDAALVELITKKAETGVFLTVLGVGTGNLKDAKMERLADNGNGIYAYLDSVREARKVLVEEMSGSLVTIAQDVKIQVEFNPAQIQSYRLLGYENRVMANQDFRNDAKDAGEIGAGHTVTAMYEVALVGAPEVKAASGQPLKYQKVAEGPKLDLTDEAKSGELLTVRLRYKKPEAKKTDEAKELEFPLKYKGGSFNSASKEFQFASAVVAFGLSLRQSEYRGSANLSAVSEIASATLGEDVGGHRAEFLDLVRRAKALRGE